MVYDDQALRWPMMTRASLKTKKPMQALAYGEVREADEVTAQDVEAHEVDEEQHYDVLSNAMMR